MLGTFQKTHLRIEVEASAKVLHDSLVRPSQLRQWLGWQRFPDGLPEQLQSGLIFKTLVGSVAIQHHVELAEPNSLRMILSDAIDGYHEWYWGEGWVQSRLEGVSLLPLNLGHTIGLLRLREFVASQAKN